MPFAAAVPYDPTRLCGYPVPDEPDYTSFLDVTSIKVLPPVSFPCPLPMGHYEEHQGRPPYEGQIYPQEFRMDYGQLIEAPVLWNGNQWLPMPKGNVTIAFTNGATKVTSDDTDDEETGAWD